MSATKERIPFVAAYDFDKLTENALTQCEYGCCKICDTVRYLEGARYIDPRASSLGATYKQLAYIAHRVGMTKEEQPAKRIPDGTLRTE